MGMSWESNEHLRISHMFGVSCSKLLTTYAILCRFHDCIYLNLIISQYRLKMSCSDLIHSGTGHIHQPSLFAAEQYPHPNTRTKIFHSQTQGGVRLLHPLRFCNIAWKKCLRRCACAPRTARTWCLWGSTGGSMLSSTSPRSLSPDS